MNRLYINWILVGIVCLLWSCYEDLGNYEYREISGVDVSFPDSVYSVLRGDSLHIVPQYEFEGGVASDFSFSWEAVITDAATAPDIVKRVVLGEGEQLHTIAKLADRSIPYKLYLYVTNKQNKLRYYFHTKLEVYSSVSKGWMVLCDDEGTARMDMVSMNEKDTVVITDILTKIEAGLPVLQGPVSIALEKGGYCLNTTSGSYILHSATLMCNPAGNLTNQIFTETPSGFYARQYFNQNSMYYLLDGEGNLYCKNAGMAGAGFGVPVNVLSGTT